MLHSRVVAPHANCLLAMGIGVSKFVVHERPYFGRRPTAGVDVIGGVEAMDGTAVARKPKSEKKF